MMVFAQLLSRCLSTVIETQGLHSPRGLTADSNERTGGSAVICFLPSPSMKNTCTMVSLLCLIQNASWQRKQTKVWGVQSADYRKARLLMWTLWNIRQEQSRRITRGLQHATKRKTQWKEEKTQGGHTGEDKYFKDTVKKVVFCVQKSDGVVFHLFSNKCVHFFAL